MSNLLYTIAVFIIIIWAIGFLGFNIGGLIDNLVEPPMGKITFKNLMLDYFILIKRKFFLIIFRIHHQNFFESRYLIFFPLQVKLLLSFFYLIF